MRYPRTGVKSSVQVEAFVVPMTAALMHRVFVENCAGRGCHYLRGDCSRQQGEHGKEWEFEHFVTADGRFCADFRADITWHIAAFYIT